MLKCTIDALSVMRPSVVVNFSHFRLLLWNRRTEFSETWQEARSQHPLPSLCFIGRSEKQDGRPVSDWLKHFRLLLWNRWRNSMKLDMKQDLNVLYQVCVFFLVGWSVKQYGRPSLWLSDTFSTSPLKPVYGIQLTKLDRKQDLNVPYQVCVFRADRKNKMAALASDWLRHFRLLLWNRWTEFNKTWQEARSQGPLPSCVFRADRKKKTRRPPQYLIVRYIFDFSSETAIWNTTKLNRKQDLNVPYQVCVFRADWKNKMVTPASNWLMHFRLFLWNRWTELNETWQEARS